MYNSTPKQYSDSGVLGIYKRKAKKPLEEIAQPEQPQNDYLSMYQQILNNQKNLVNQQYTSAYNSIDAQRQQIAPTYDALRGQAYSNARLSAIGNNEVLAAQGLAGNLYQSATSGISETARIQQDVALRNLVASYSDEEQAQFNAVANAVREAQAIRDQQLSGIQENYDIKAMEETQRQQGIEEQKNLEQQTLLNNTLSEINNADDFSLDSLETQLRQNLDTKQISEESYKYLKSEIERKRAGTAFTFTGEDGQKYDLDTETAKLIYDEIMALTDLSPEEKKFYEDEYKKRYGTTAQPNIPNSTITEDFAKKYSVSDKKGVSIISAKATDFGKYLGSDNSDSKQTKYVNAVLKAAKENKIPNGTTINFNYGESTKQGSVYVYYDGKFYKTSKSYYAADYSNRDITKGHNISKAFKKLVPDAEF